MESFALFYNAMLQNKKATTLLLVTDSFITHEKMTSKQREESLDSLFLLALDMSLKLEN